MNIDNYIKSKTEEMVNELKQKFLFQGMVMTERDESFLRTGMGYGITLASLALCNLPIDITLGKSFEDKKEDNKPLQSLDEYKSSHINATYPYDITREYSDPLCQCPNCDGGMRKNLQIICTTNPPKYEYKCDKCGFKIYLPN